LDREASFEVTFVRDALPGTIRFDFFVTAGDAQLVRRKTAFTTRGNAESDRWREGDHREARPTAMGLTPAMRRTKGAD